MICPRGHETGKGKYGKPWICKTCIKHKLERGEYLEAWQKRESDRLQQEHKRKKLDTGLVQDMTVRRRPKNV